MIRNGIHSFKEIVRKYIVGFRTQITDGENRCVNVVLESLWFVKSKVCGKQRHFLFVRVLNWGLQQCPYTLL